MSDELPKGWASARLEEIVTKKKGKKPAVLRDTPADGFVPYLDIHAIEKNVVRQFAEAKSSKLASKDDLFVVWDGARSGWIGGGITGAIGSTIMALTAQQTESRYVRHFIASQFQMLNNNTRGTGIPHVDPEAFWNLEVPLAPLPEQRRIVAKLETVLGKVDASQQRLAKIPVLLKRFRQSVLAAACSGRLTADWREENPSDDEEMVDGRQSDDLPESWSISRVEKLAKIGSGQSSKLIISKCETASEIPWFKVSDMNLEGNEKFMRRSQNYLSRRNVDELGMKVFPTGTIIFPKRGGAISTNKKRILTQPSCIDSNTMALTPHACSADYFWTWFCTMDLGRLADGSSVPQINNPDILPLKVPLPPLPEQQEIVRRVEGLFALADQLEERLAKARGQVDQLTPSLLARAFAGQLVPQDPTDEPAEQLLERIRVTRK